MPLSLLLSEQIKSDPLVGSPPFHVFLLPDVLQMNCHLDFKEVCKIYPQS